MWLVVCNIYDPIIRCVFTSNIKIVTTFNFTNLTNYRIRRLAGGNRFHFRSGIEKHVGNL